MSWLVGLAIFTMVTGVTLTLVGLMAVRSLRRTLLDGALRQAQQIRRLVETVSVLHQQQQNTQARVQLLAEANRKLTEELAVLSEQVGEGTVRMRGPSRMLH